MKPVRIVVADDHDLVRRGLRTLLEVQRGWKVVAEAASGAEAVAKVKRSKPDVVVIDISLGDSNGLDATREILAARPETEVLVLTMHESEQVMREVMSAGARGYVSKSDAERELVTAVRSLSRHQPFFTAKGTQMMLDAWQGSGEASRSDSPERSLSPRQREVVRLLAEGKSNKEVAAALGISVKTAETHRTNVMRKLNVNSLSHLVRYAVRYKIVDS